MSVRQAIDSIFENQLADMKQHLSNALTTKAVERLEERKVVIGQNYFGQDTVNEDVEQVDEVMDTLPKMIDYVKKHNESEKKATASGDKNTLRKRKRGEKLVTNLRDRKIAAWKKSVKG